MLVKGLKSFNGFAFKLPFYLFFLILIISLSIFLPKTVFSLPKGHRVIRGNVEIDQDALNMQIHASNNSIVEYDSFNIQRDQTLRFVQPSSQARVLNRVTGAGASEILGKLYANGQVYLINPSGIYFGQNALVDVARLYAIGGALHNEDFLNKIHDFQNIQGDIINQGMISAEAVYLLGRYVANMGSILSQDGMIALVSGPHILLREKEGHIFFELEDELDPKTQRKKPGSQIDQMGTLNAHKGEIFIGARDWVYAIAIRHQGKSIAKKITLQAEDAPLQVSGELIAKEGQMHLEGSEVTFTDAFLDISGSKGGELTVFAEKIRAQDLIIEADVNVKKELEDLLDVSMQKQVAKLALFTEELHLDQVKVNLNAPSSQGGDFFITSDEDLFYQHLVKLTPEAYRDVRVVSFERLRQRTKKDGNSPSLDVPEKNFSIKNLHLNSQARIGSSVQMLSQGAFSLEQSQIHIKGFLKGGEYVQGGEKLYLEDNFIDVSADGDGGNIWIGGKWQGGGDFIKAKELFVGRDVFLHANSTHKGKGGELVLWSEENTRFYGEILARGGPLSGDAGRAEVSGKKALGFHGRVDLYAKNGDLGLLLLDPEDVIISSSGSDVAFLPTVLEGDQAGADMYFSTSSLVSSLDSSDVTIQASGDIAIFSTLSSLSNDNSYDLNLEAGGEIEVAGRISLIGGLSLQADEDLIIDDDIYTEADTLLQADADQSGQGSFSMGLNDLIVYGGDLFISGADLDIPAVALIEAELGDLTLVASAGAAIGMGNASQENFTIPSAFLTDSSRLFVENLRVGDATTSLIRIYDIVIQASHEAINDTVFLNAEKIEFLSGPMSFPTLQARADDAIVVQGDLSTAVGNLQLIADQDHSPDVSDSISIESDASIHSENDLLLEAENGLIIAGDVELTLSANNALFVNPSIQTQKDVQLISDADGDGQGDLVFSDDLSVVIQDHNLTVHSPDFTLPSAVDLGEGKLILKGSSQQSMSMGQSMAQYHVTSSNLSTVIAKQVELGGDETPYILIDGLELSDFSSIDGGLILQAGASSGSIEFSGQDSSFYALDAQAADGIDVQVNLSSLSGDLHLDADVDLQEGSSDTLSIDNQVQLISSGNLELSAIHGGISFSGALLQAQGDVTINSAFNSIVDVTLVADSNADGQGSFIMAENAQVDTQDNHLFLALDDWELNAPLNTGEGSVYLTIQDGGSLALGDTSADFSLSGEELSKIQTQGLYLGQSQSPLEVFISNVSAQDSQAIEKLYIEAHQENSQVFIQGDNQFTSLHVSAYDGIQIEGDLETFSYDLFLDADADAKEGMRDVLELAQDSRLFSAESLTLKAELGGIQALGDLQIHANKDIILDDLVVQGDLLLHAGRDTNQGGALLQEKGKIEASFLDIRSSKEIGSPDKPLEIAVDRLRLAVEKPGDVCLYTEDAIVLEDLDTDQGSIYLQSKNDVYLDGIIALGQGDLRVDANGYGIYQQSGMIKTFVNGDVYFTSKDLELSLIELAQGGQLHKDVDNDSQGQAYHFYVKGFQINKDLIDEDLVDFPVLVALDASHFDFSQADTMGRNLRFVDAKGHLLAYEIELWDPEGGRAFLWVQVPEVSSQTNTSFWLYHAQEELNYSRQRPDAIWKDHELVEHFEDEGSSFWGSSQNNHEAIATAIGLEDSQIGKGVFFDGSQSALKYQNFSKDLPSQDLSISFWLRADLQKEQSLFSLENFDTERFAFLPHQSDGTSLWILGDPSSVGTLDFSAENYLEKMHFITLDADQNTQKMQIYLDGEIIAQKSSDAVFQNLIEDHFVLGEDALGNYFQGQLDEFRIAGQVFSPAYVKASYSNQKNPLLVSESSFFYSMGESTQVSNIQEDTPSQESEKEQSSSNLQGETSFVFFEEELLQEKLRNVLSLGQEGFQENQGGGQHQLSVSDASDVFRSSSLVGGSILDEILQMAHFFESSDFEGYSFRKLFFIDTYNDKELEEDENQAFD